MRETILQLMFPLFLRLFCVKLTNTNCHKVQEILGSCKSWWNYSQDTRNFVTVTYFLSHYISLDVCTWCRTLPFQNLLWSWLWRRRTEYDLRARSRDLPRDLHKDNSLSVLYLFITSTRLQGGGVGSHFFDNLQGSHFIVFFAGLILFCLLCLGVNVP